MIEIARAGGFTTGGFNFDAKVRRQSIDAEDLLHGHIGGIDTVTHGFIKAAAIIEDGLIDVFRAQRYAGWQGDLGKTLRRSNLAEIADLCINRNLAPVRKSGRQERLKNVIIRF